MEEAEPGAGQFCGVLLTPRASRVGRARTHLCCIQNVLWSGRGESQPGEAAWATCRSNRNFEGGFSRIISLLVLLSGSERPPKTLRGHPKELPPSPALQQLPGGGNPGEPGIPPGCCHLVNNSQRCLAPSAWSEEGSPTPTAVPWLTWAGDQIMTLHDPWNQHRYLGGCTTSECCW